MEASEYEEKAVEAQGLAVRRAPRWSCRWVNIVKASLFAAEQAVSSGFGCAESVKMVMQVGPC